MNGWVENLLLGARKGWHRKISCGSQIGRIRRISAHAQIIRRNWLPDRAGIWVVNVRESALARALLTDAWMLIGWGDCPVWIFWQKRIVPVISWLWTDLDFHCSPLTIAENRTEKVVVLDQGQDCRRRKACGCLHKGGFTYLVSARKRRGWNQNFKKVRSFIIVVTIIFSSVIVPMAPSARYFYLACNCCRKEMRFDHT